MISKQIFKYIYIDAETHFDVIIVSKKFENQTILEVRAHIIYFIIIIIIIIINYIFLIIIIYSVQNI
jgi:hypothetical protein